jgi:hypothetical protein
MSFNNILVICLGCYRPANGSSICLPREESSGRKTDAFNAGFLQSITKPLAVDAFLIAVLNAV